LAPGGWTRWPCVHVRVWGGFVQTGTLAAGAREGAGGCGRARASARVGCTCVSGCGAGSRMFSVHMSGCGTDSHGGGSHKLACWPCMPAFFKRMGFPALVGLIVVVAGKNPTVLTDHPPRHDSLNRWISRSPKTPAFCKWHFQPLPTVDCRCTRAFVHGVCMGCKHRARNASAMHTMPRPQSRANIVSRT
jgi:hypothetical protein